MYANAVVDCHQDFDIVDFAEQFFDTGSRCLIVKEQGRKPHWHVHGTWKGDREAYKEYPHPAREGEGRKKTRPVRVAFDKDELGFQYICKEDPPNVVRQWHISDEQIAQWHAASEKHKTDTRKRLRDAMKEVDLRDDAKEQYRELKRACYDWLTQEDKLLNPNNVKQHVLTYMWTELPQYKGFVLDQ
jgi:hypothetical protein